MGLESQRVDKWKRHTMTRLYPLLDRFPELKREVMRRRSIKVATRLVLTGMITAYLTYLVFYV